MPLTPFPIPKDELVPDTYPLADPECRGCWVREAGMTGPGRWVTEDEARRAWERNQELWWPTSIEWLRMRADENVLHSVDRLRLIPTATPRISSSSLPPNLARRARALFHLPKVVARETYAIANSSTWRPFHEVPRDVKRLQHLQLTKPDKLSPEIWDNFPQVEGYEEIVASLNKWTDHRQGPDSQYYSLRRVLWLEDILSEWRCRNPSAAEPPLHLAELSTQVLDLFRSELQGYWRMATGFAERSIENSFSIANHPSEFPVDNWLDLIQHIGVKVPDIRTKHEKVGFISDPIDWHPATNEKQILLNILERSLYDVVSNWAWGEEVYKVLRRCVNDLMVQGSVIIWVSSHDELYQRAWIASVFGERAPNARPRPTFVDQSWRSEPEPKVGIPLLHPLLPLQLFNSTGGWNLNQGPFLPKGAQIQTNLAGPDPRSALIQHCRTSSVAFRDTFNRAWEWDLHLRPRDYDTPGRIVRSMVGLSWPL